MEVRHGIRAVRGERRSDERGETLIEIMATVLLVGLAIVAILGTIFVAVKVTQSHRKSTKSSNQAFDFAEELLRTDAEQPYQPCDAGTPNYAYSLSQPGYAVSVVDIEYLVSQATATQSWQATCPATDQGLQKLTIRVVSPPDVEEVETIQVIKRNRTCGDGRGEQC